MKTLHIKVGELEFYIPLKNLPYKNDDANTTVELKEIPTFDKDGNELKD